jgi:hypothetical protein
VQPYTQGLADEAGLGGRMGYSATGTMSGTGGMRRGGAPLSMSMSGAGGGLDDCGYGHGSGGGGMGTSGAMMGRPSTAPDGGAGGDLFAAPRFRSGMFGGTVGGCTS